MTKSFEERQKTRKLSRRDLIRQISESTLIRPEVVETVIDSMTDIAIETVAQGDVFVLKNLVSLEAKDWSERKIPDRTNQNKEILVKKSKRVVATASVALRKLVKLQLLVLADKPLIVNRKTWRDALEWMKSGKSKEFDESFTIVQKDNVNEKPSNTAGLPTRKQNLGNNMSNNHGLPRKPMR